VVLSRAELLELAAEQAERGSVAAIKLLLEELRRDEDVGSGSEFDALDNVAPIRREA
jgi:hypothetical protein